MNSKLVILAEREMLEITKMLDGVWKRKSFDDSTNHAAPVESRSNNLSKKEKRNSWSPGKHAPEFNITDVNLGDDVQKRHDHNGNRARPKSYAEPSSDLGTKFGHNLCFILVVESQNF